MLTFIEIIVGLAVLGFLVMVIYAAMKPTDNTRVVTEEMTPLKLESMDDKEAVFSTQMPLRNTGVEDAAITDVFARPYLPQEQFPDAVCWAHVETLHRRRNDNYFEALILKANTEVPLIVTLHYEARNDKNIKEVLSKMVDMDAAVYYNGMARKAIYIKKNFFTIHREVITNLVGGNKQ
ncbi:MAG: hypothetical protein LKJ99_02195 [Acidaminococcaceae bacterium]|jgi:hypothetical protein|nr:hypothetical protein [Acidaminococcaceae bacterium]MCI2109770.1 hypothetical protein [Acidaminococcaceae bacterium]